MNEPQKQFERREEENRFLHYLSELILSKINFYKAIQEDPQDASAQIKDTALEYLSFYISIRGKQIQPNNKPAYIPELSRLYNKLYKIMQEEAKRQQAKDGEFERLLNELKKKSKT